MHHTYPTHQFTLHTLHTLHIPMHPMYTFTPYTLYVALHKICTTFWLVRAPHHSLHIPTYPCVPPLQVPTMYPYPMHHTQTYAPLLHISTTYTYIPLPYTPLHTIRHPYTLLYILHTLMDPCPLHCYPSMYAPYALLCTPTQLYVPYSPNTSYAPLLYAPLCKHSDWLELPTTTNESTGM